MSPMDNNAARGGITFHVSMLKSEFQECRAEVKEAPGRRGSPSPPGSKRSPAESCARARGRDVASPPCAPKLGAKQERLNHASLRRLKAQMEAASQQAKEITQPLLDTEKGLVKDLERFLSRRHVTELRRRELLHKRWTERVWLPLQRSVEERASSRGPAALRRRQGSYRHYLHHCNTKTMEGEEERLQKRRRHKSAYANGVKSSYSGVTHSDGCYSADMVTSEGFVFLDTWDLREYNPFLVHIKEPHLFKLSADALKDPLNLQSHERLKEKGTPRAGWDYTRKQVEKRSQSGPPHCETTNCSRPHLITQSLQPHCRVRLKE